MVDGDQDRIRLVYSLAFSLPGTPVLFYGEEIGMLENLEIDGRMSVRSPMQWTSERHRGFTTADEPCAPARRPATPRWRRSAAIPDSLLTWMERMIRRRRECPELGWGEVTLLDAGDPAVFAHRADWDEQQRSSPSTRSPRSRARCGSRSATRRPAVDLFGADELDAARRATSPSSSAATATAGSGSAGRASASRPRRSRARRGRDAGGEHVAAGPRDHCAGGDHRVVAGRRPGGRWRRR